VELRGAYAEAGGARLAVVLELMPGGSLADAIARRGALVRRRARKREKEAERERKKKIMEQGGEEAAVEAEKAPSTSSSSFSSFVPLGLPERAVARVALGALTGLARIRELGLVHRDVKPANILLDGDVVALCEKEEAEEGEKKRAGGCGDDDDDKTDPFSSLNAKVADFGLASAGANGGGGAGFDGSIAACTTFVGTVTYMSPERATSANPADGGGGNGSSNDGSGDGGGGGEGGGVGSGSKGSRNQTKAGYSAPADVWALGLTLMEAATGIYPYALVSSRGNGNGGAETGARGNSNNDDNSNNSNPAAAAARAIAAAGPLALLMQVVTDPAPVLPDDGAGFTAAFSDFLARCLEKDPRRRATARELLSHPWVVSGGRGEKVRRSCSAVLARPLPPPAAPVAPPSSSSVLARAPLRLPSASFSSSSSRSSPSASLEGPPSPPPDAAAAAASVAASSPRGARGASSSPPPPPPPLLTAAAATVFSSPERASSPPTLPRGGGENAAGGVGVGGVGRVGAGVQARATTQALPLPPRLPFSSPSRTATITTTTATAADARALSLATLRARFSSNSQPGARRAALAPLYDRGVSLRPEGRPAVLRGARAALDAWDAEASGRESLGATGEAEVLGVDVLAVGGLAAREAVEGAVAGGVEEAVEGGGGEEAAEKGGKGKGKGDGDDASASSCPSCCFLVHVTGTVPGPALGPFAAAAAAAAAGGGRGFGGGGRRTAFAEALVVVCSGRGRGGTAEKSDAAPAAACSSSSLPFGGLRITSHTFRTLR
jgi:serine/threonine protein kinase